MRKTTRSSLQATSSSSRIAAVTAAKALCLWWSVSSSILHLVEVADAFQSSASASVVYRRSHITSTKSSTSTSRRLFHPKILYATPLDAIRNDPETKNNGGDSSTDIPFPQIANTTIIATVILEEVESLQSQAKTTGNIIEADANANSAFASASCASQNSTSFPPAPTLRECLSFALPALGIYACPPLMSLIDSAFIGRTAAAAGSSLELAALGPASSISDSAPLPLLFLSIASTNLIAKAFSRNDTQSLVRISRTALTLGSMGGVVLALALYQSALPLSFLYCGEKAATTMTTAGAVVALQQQQLLAPLCSQYVAIRALALPAVVVTTIAQAICIGTKDTTTPMISVALAGVLNLLGDFVLVRGLGQGIAGAAWATAASQMVAAGLLLRVLKKRGFLARQADNYDDTITTVDSIHKKTGAIHRRMFRIRPSTMDTVRQLFAFVPFLFVMGVKIGWHNACASTAASLGGAQAAAHTALLSVGMLCFVLNDVGSSLAQAFIPAFVTEQPPVVADVAATSNTKQEPHFDLEAAMPTIRQVLKCTLCISATVVGLASIIIGRLGSFITHDPAVLSTMKRTLPWVATALSLHGSAVTLEGILLAQKKLRGLTIFYSFLAFTILGFQVATRQWGLGLMGVWGCYCWVCGSRVFAFSALGGLLNPRKWWGRDKARKQQQIASSN